MKTKRIKITEEDEVIFNTLKKQKRVNTDELFSILIHSYYATVKQENELVKRINVVEEYVKLLIKANTNLPKDENEMEKIVEADSRFSSLIEKKVNKDD